MYLRFSIFRLLLFFNTSIMQKKIIKHQIPTCKNRDVIETFEKYEARKHRYDETKQNRRRHCQNVHAEHAEWFWRLWHDVRQRTAFLAIRTTTSDGVVLLIQNQ